MGCYNISNTNRKERIKTMTIKSNNFFENINSEYIQKQIFEFLPRYKSLEIIRCNKKLIRLLNTNIIEYKELSTKYSPIIIEVKPALNKFGDFIKLNKVEEKSNYHIYFNDSKKETDKLKISPGDNIQKILIKIDNKIQSLSGLFSRCYCIESIDFKVFYRNDIYDMSYMFDGCSALKEIKFSSFRTDNVTKMNWMFSGCSSLKEINLSFFNTINVVNMSGMFSGCSSLKKLDVFYLDTNNVEDMSYMFSECSLLKELNLSKFFNNKDINININCMFSKCSNGLKTFVKNNYPNISNRAF